MKKRTLALILSALLTLSACGGSTSPETADDLSPDEPLTWQEQYDLGLRYLSEGNYEEAILAFTAAIEIDPKRPEAYVGRGDAYVLSGETEEHLTAAQVDYEKALELDERCEDAYMGIADIYIRQGRYEEAYELLKKALELIGPGAEKVAAKIAEIESGIYADAQDHIRRSNTYTLDGKLESYAVYHYDFLGRRSSWENYGHWDEDVSDENAIVLTSRCEVTFNSFNEPEKYQFYGPEGDITHTQIYQYNEQHQKIRADRYGTDGALVCYYIFYYNDIGLQYKYEYYEADGTLGSTWVTEFDENHNPVREVCYDAQGNESNYSTFE